MNKYATLIDINIELEKCKKSPYYFAITYLTVNGLPFTTRHTEKEFNNIFKTYNQLSITK